MSHFPGFMAAVFTCGRVKTDVFENADLAFTCGRMKTEVFENDDSRLPPIQRRK